MFINKKGFTLTELIAVIVILSVLAMVAVGSYRKALERSRMGEAYNIGSTLLEAVNRYYYDNRARTDRKCPKVSDLDVGVAKKAAQGDYSVTTQYFTITIPSNCNDTAPVIKATSQNGGYAIEFFPDFSTLSQEKCSYTTDKGKAFCVTAGYKSCNDSSKFCCKGTYSGSICR